MLQALCSVLHAPCPMPHAPFSILHAPPPHSPFSILHASCSVLHVPCPKLLFFLPQKGSKPPTQPMSRDTRQSAHLCTATSLNSLSVTAGSLFGQPAASGKGSLLFLAGDIASATPFPAPPPGSSETPPCENHCGWSLRSPGVLVDRSCGQGKLTTVGIPGSSSLSPCQFLDVIGVCGLEMNHLQVGKVCSIVVGIHYQSTGSSIVPKSTQIV